MDRLFQCLGVMVAIAEEVRIPGREVSAFLKKAKKLGAFENKAIRVVTPSQARKETTERKLLEQ